MFRAHLLQYPVRSTLVRVYLLPATVMVTSAMPVVYLLTL